MFNFFVVLGQVPGTNLQITFNEMLIVYGLIACGTIIYALRTPKLSAPKRLSRVYQLSQFPDYKNTYIIPVQPATRPKAAALPANTYFSWLNQHWRIVH